MVHKCTHLEQIPLNGLEIIGPFCGFVYFFLCKRLQLLGYSYCDNRVQYGELDISRYVFTCLTTDPYRIPSGSKRYRTVNTSSLDEIPASWDRVGKVGVSEANRDGFEGKRPSP